jgi:hypothetical protein
MEAPHVEGEGRYVHFSWKEEAFCLRDFIRQTERRQERGCNATDIWKAALERIPAKGELYVPIDNFEFWTAKLSEMTESRTSGKPSSLWSRLSSKFSAKRSQRQDAEIGDEVIASNASVRLENPNGDPYRHFASVWNTEKGFHIVDGSVGCSARYRGEPLLWVYPTYFQIAPQGKGNTHHQELTAIRDRFFPEARKTSIQYESKHFTWDRFQSFIVEAQKTIQSAI